MSYARTVAIVFALAAAPAVPARLAAQAPLAIGGEEERLLRWLQALERVPSHQLSLRGYGPEELEAMLGDSASGLRLLPASAAFTGNSRFAWGANDGPVWAGRGVTVLGEGGGWWRWRSLSAVVAPVAFVTQNARFDLMANGRTGDTVYADPNAPLRIDLPQRFGDAAYGVLDPGASTLRVDSRGFTLGVSTANVAWGPAARFPLLMGSNAAGVPHLFLGTSRPRDVGFALVHARAYWARLDPSKWFFGPVSDRRRIGAGLAIVLEPRGLAGLEIGAARFFHQVWPAGGLRWSDVTKPFEGVFKKSISNDSTFGQNADNQLLSVFARWLLVDAGVELYGEFGREDHNWDIEDFLLEPDHSAAYTLGFAKVWRRTGVPVVAGGPGRVTGLVGLRGEVSNAQKNRTDLTRSQPIWYTHGAARQGHTQRGQILGSDAVHGGAGAWLALDWYDATGRWTFSWTRELRQQEGRFLTTGVENPRGLDVWHALGAERLWRRGGLDMLAGLTAVYNFNRNYGGDAFNLNAQLRVTAYPGGRPSRLPWPGH